MGWERGEVKVEISEFSNVSASLRSVKEVPRLCTRGTVCSAYAETRLLAASKRTLGVSAILDRPAVPLSVLSDEDNVWN